MRAKFSQSFKIQAVEKVLSRSNGTTMSQVANDLQVSLSSLNKWIVQSREQALEPGTEVGLMSQSKEKRPQDWSLQERLQIIIQCDGLSDEEASSICREQGLHRHHLSQWKKDFTSSQVVQSPTEKAKLKALKNENKSLKREVHRKDKALAETAALLVLQKKVSMRFGKRRGQLTMSSEREAILSLITEACDAGARQSKACDIIGISAKTFQRWRQSANQIDGRLERNHEPKNKLNELERQQILAIANEDKYADLPPSKIVPLLADEGCYIASESTFYRVLKAAKQLKHREKVNKKTAEASSRALTATKPNQIYSWDITYLPTQVRGVFLYLYLVLDIYSRKIVGWQVYQNESSALAADLMTAICEQENIQKNQVVLHSDNGSPMKGATLLATLQELGIIPSFSRPSVSNDNPYSESAFRTLKYRPNYPESPFDGLLSARCWVAEFIAWYNKEHLHSAIKFVTPEQRHNGEDIKILKARHEVYQRAKKNNPIRWSGETRNWQPVGEVYLNPDKPKLVEQINRAA
ncbi:MAG: IS3 family transposase [Enterobacterales bacterium]|nr:IS3 family transposase [Enterobacterales bacterium]